MLRQRVLSSIVFIPPVIAAIWFGSPWFSVLVGIAALLGLIEFFNMTDQLRLQPLTVVGFLWTIFFIISAQYSQYLEDHDLSIIPLALVISAVFISLLIMIVSRSLERGSLILWSWGLIGMFYMGFLLGHWIQLMNEFGRDWVLLALFSTFAVDTTAYFVGRAWGKHKMAPSISPGKTWEGAVGGFIGAIAAASLLALLPQIDLAYWKVIILGTLIGVFAQLGDLTESKLKRAVGVKEAGGIIPGHGGILDRLDSIVFVGVVVYYWAYYCS